MISGDEHSLYNALRHLADSWGLIGLGVVFLVCVGFALRPAARDHHHRAATSILDADHDR